MSFQIDKPIAIVIHHSVTRKGNDLNDEKRIWEEIKRYGIQKNGRPDYHFGVGSSGNWYAGCPLYEWAVHMGIDKWEKYQDKSGVNNQNSFGICAIGNFEEYEMEEKQIMGIVNRIQYLKMNYGKNMFVKLHRELVATACPGRLFPYKTIYEKLKGNGMATKVFYDVDQRRWSFPAIKKVTDLGIMNGDSEGTFRPLENCTREEIAQIITNLLKYLGKG
jgi:hypothetical protein